MAGAEEKFPIDLKQFKKCVRLIPTSHDPCSNPVFARRLKLDPSKPQLSNEQRKTLKANIQLLRDAIVLFTATGAARGVSGHTGQPDAPR